jgi:hypothetical protein
VTLIETILKHSWQDDMVGPHLVRVDDAIDALRKWLADEGLVVVPKKCTEDMAGYAGARAEARGDIRMFPGEYRHAWEAMIAAAPDVLKAQDPAP